MYSQHTCCVYRRHSPTQVFDICCKEWSRLLVSVLVTLCDALKAAIFSIRLFQVLFRSKASQCIYEDFMTALYIVFGPLHLRVLNPLYIYVGSSAWMYWSVDVVSYLVHLTFPGPPKSVSLGSLVPSLHLGPRHSSARYAPYPCLWSFPRKFIIEGEFAMH